MRQLHAATETPLVNIISIIIVIVWLPHSKTTIFADAHLVTISTLHVLFRRFFIGSELASHTNTVHKLPEADEFSGLVSFLEFFIACTHDRTLLRRNNIIWIDRWSFTVSGT